MAALKTKKSPVATKKTLEQWKKEVDTLFMDIRENYIKLGEIIYSIRQQITAEEYAAFEKHISSHHGHKKADLEAAKAAFLFRNPTLGKPDNGNDKEKRIDPRLLFAGARNQKILRMDKADQERLLGREKFQTVMANGKIDTPKTWMELSDTQRDVLIGVNGEIFTVDKQLASLKGVRKNAVIHTVGRLELKKQGVFVSGRDERIQLQCSLTEFAKMILTDEGFWESLESAIEDVQQELGSSARRSAR